jgi:putative membrane protein
MAGALLDIVTRIVINAVALIAAMKIVPGAVFNGEWWQLLAVAAIFGLINAYLRPIVKLLSLPLNLLSLGLVGVVINTGLVMLLAFISGQLKLGFTLHGWPPGPIDLQVIFVALLTAIVVSVVSALLAIVRMVTPRA